MVKGSSRSCACCAMVHARSELKVTKPVLPKAFEPTTTVVNKWAAWYVVRVKMRGSG